jgi:hypothetical protein
MDEVFKVYTFDRYRRGELMAQEIQITKAPSFAVAARAAALLASSRDVLVLRPEPEAA